MPRKSKLEKNSEELSYGLMEDFIREQYEDRQFVVTIKTGQPPRSTFESVRQMRERKHKEWLEWALNYMEKSIESRRATNERVASFLSRRNG
jgi:6-phosphogluconolactonase/glucosamine-6-phosphate isomerase/deaminase